MYNVNCINQKYSRKEQCTIYNTQYTNKPFYNFLSSQVLPSNEVITRNILAWDNVQPTIYSIQMSTKIIIDSSNDN